MIQSKIWEAMKEVMANAEAEVEKFYEKGNSSAGTRARKAMQELKGLASQLREEIQSKKSEGKAE